jgi:RimJ/RimL family protein N-acetyltransferase
MLRGVRELALPDGTRLAVRPLEAEDKDELREGIEHLSPSSRYRRFFVPTVRLSDAELTYLTTLDHTRHEALVAIDPRTDDGVGVARYVVTDEAPATAEIAVTVNDAWQGRGVGRALLGELARVAREHGIEHFSAMILTDNQPMIRLAESVGPVVSRHAEGGTVTLVVKL